jgi:hypothetical protein
MVNLHERVAHLLEAGVKVRRDRFAVGVLPGMSASAPLRPGCPHMGSPGPASTPDDPGKDSGVVARLHPDSGRWTWPPSGA